MFSVALRFVAGLAVGAAAALWLTSRRSAARNDSSRASRTITDQRAPERAVPQHLSTDTADGDGRIDAAAPIDGAVEDTFPASDPPAFMQALIAGRPPHEEAAVVDRRQARKRADEDAFAE